MPTATIQMKNSAIDSTSEIFRADQVSMCRSCSRARRGPRPAPLRPRAPTVVGEPLGWAVVAPAAAGPAPVAGGTGGAPGGPPAGRTVAADAPVTGPWAFCAPVVGIDCVPEAGVGSPGAVPLGAAASP